MQCQSVFIERLQLPQDSLFDKIAASGLELANGDVVVIASKVVAIAEGRCVEKGEEKVRQLKDRLVRQEADRYVDRDHVPGRAVMHAYLHGQMAVSAGVDPVGEYFVLWPKDPMQAAEDLHTWFCKEYGLTQLGVIVSDSKSTPLRRGVIGGAIGWAGMEPLFDNRSRTDFYGKPSGGSQINIVDAVAAAAVLVMGEGNEQTPLVRVTDVPYRNEGYVPRKQRDTSFVVPMEEDIFAPFYVTDVWSEGGASKER